MESEFIESLRSRGYSVVINEIEDNPTSHVKLITATRGKKSLAYVLKKFDVSGEMRETLKGYGQLATIVAPPEIVYLNQKAGEIAYLFNGKGFEAKIQSNDPQRMLAMQELSDLLKQIHGKDEKTVDTQTNLYNIKKFPQNLMGKLVRKRSDEIPEDKTLVYNGKPKDIIYTEKIEYTPKEGETPIDMEKVVSAIKESAKTGKLSEAQTEELVQLFVIDCEDKAHEGADLLALKDLIEQYKRERLKKNRVGAIRNIGKLVNKKQERNIILSKAAVIASISMAGLFVTNSFTGNAIADIGTSNSNIFALVFVIVGLGITAFLVKKSN